jgi:hypothetical protein
MGIADARNSSSEAVEGFWGGKQTAGAKQGARAPAEKADVTFKPKFRI